ncbi:hypothetical protein [Geomesophilobacter sediminis]|uniref:Methyl-accepting chemotaxis protein n=1 Tax=Geomesophilobacter sediminis TaxID=2798584 RepID=A0A8J7LYM2_9BACT|nr:hypothetical protein [Geomesophilobacter sediminis]MBJ6725092.1 hypothetical protein [Geomesophilobacter sediminis]
MAVEEQTATIGEINNSHQITSVATMTSVTSHEEAEAVNQLARLAVGLKAVVERFRLQ